MKNLISDPHTCTLAEAGNWSQEKKKIKQSNTSQQLQWITSEDNEASMYIYIHTHIYLSQQEQCHLQTFYKGNLENFKKVSTSFADVYVLLALIKL